MLTRTCCCAESGAKLGKGCSVAGQQEGLHAAGGLGGGNPWYGWRSTGLMAVRPASALGGGLKLQDHPQAVLL